MDIAEREIPISLRVEFLDLSEKCDDGPNLVLALDRDPVGMPGIFETIPDDPEQVVRLPLPHRLQRSWRRLLVRDMNSASPPRLKSKIGRSRPQLP